MQVELIHVLSLYNSSYELVECMKSKILNKKHISFLLNIQKLNGRFFINTLCFLVLLKIQTGKGSLNAANSFLPQTLQMIIIIHSQHSEGDSFV